jgi:hypothetical protein
MPAVRWRLSPASRILVVDAGACVDGIIHRGLRRHGCKLSAAIEMVRASGSRAVVCCSACAKTSWRPTVSTGRTASMI